ncbi:MAG TPA: acyl-CoA dehydrogenase family protein [Actinomycetota bacterium]|nr:acyl-CoA dehydrogenase family protein [Actinomycetota bacterium]
MGDFLQTAPRLPDAWGGDRILREGLAYHLGDEVFAAAEPELRDLGRAVTDVRVLDLAARAEREPPRHVPYSPWGERVDDIQVSDAYTELGGMGVEAGVTALPYEADPYGDKARLVWAGVLSLWGPSSALASCPVAMTDGAARTLDVHGGDADQDIIERLTTRDPSRAWSSGQWMTETAGGSDVGRTATVARRDEDGSWRLWGTKWFTSATTSEMALTLARPEGGPEGSKGLVLFRVHRFLDDRTRNRIVVRRLKDKLGTRALPTAELELEGALAWPVGEPELGSGVRRIATMLNITRMHNALGASGALGRGLAWARAYAREREVFGRPLHELPAHRATLTDLAVDYAASLALVLRCCELAGRQEHHVGGENESAVLRCLTPVTKLSTGRWAIAGVTEAMEAIGGVGYCEDSTIPALVRNTHVIPIWEGTTNVLSLDVLRSAQRSNALEALLDDARPLVADLVDDPRSGETARAVLTALDDLTKRSVEMADDAQRAEAGARSLALGTGSTYACALLCRQGHWAARRGHESTAAIAVRLATRGLVPPAPPLDLSIAMGNG